MATTQTEIQSQVIDLSADAFEAFCEDISGMFDVDMECSQQESCTETVKGLKKRFKKLVAVNSVKTEGVLDGTFQLVFDQGGLFTLSGIIVMLPENRILEEIKRGTVKDSDSMTDAVKEVGNMLVGSWDRIFREELEGHGHFVQANTFIGNPWDNPEEKIGLAGDEEFSFVPYEITIGSYPAFNCGVIFPKTLFGRTSETKPQQADNAEEKPQEEQKEKPETEVAQKAQEQQAVVEPQSETVAQAEQSRQSAAEPESEAIAEESPTTANIPVDAEDVFVAGGVFETIQKITQSPADLPGDASAISLAISAKDIMQKEVCWITPEDSVQDALTKMQQVNSGYVLVGTNGVLEGILSKSDIAGAVSIYLRPIFAKWHRKLDDATLNIRVKWIMTRPVHTIKPDTSLVVIMENMSRFSGKCLPVIDQQNKVQGLVTVFDIFRAMLNSNPDAPLVGKAIQIPSLA